MTKHRIAVHVDAASVEAATRAVDGGVCVVVTAKPKSAVDAVVRAADTGLLVKTRAAPVDGKANDAIALMIAHLVGVAKTRVTLVRGGSARIKEFLIADVSLQDVRRAMTNDVDDDRLR